MGFPRWLNELCDLMGLPAGVTAVCISCRVGELPTITAEIIAPTQLELSESAKTELKSWILLDPPRVELYDDDRCEHCGFPLRDGVCSNLCGVENVG